MDCLGLLIIGFVIFWIVRTKSRNGNQTTKPNQPRKSQPKPNQPVRQSRPVRPNQPMRQQNQPMGQRQPVKGTVSSTPGHQTGTTYTKPAAPTKQEEDILAKANRNVREQQMEKQEELKARLTQKYGEIPKEQKSGKPLGKEKAPAVSGVEQEAQTGDLMREINDLMVKGYDGELTFSRDFVAEGIEMLNRIQM